jgi:hypothetical protein
MGITVNLNRRIFRFLILMRFIKPTIWRSIELDEDATFWDLHMAIQDVMSWDNAHLHEFIISDPHTKHDLVIGISIDDRFMDPGEQPDPAWMRELSSVFIDIGEKATYRYDFGDGWECDVILEGMFLSPKKVKYPRCVAGERAAPPENCGGVGGYYGLLEVLADPNDEEHKDILRWLKGTRPRKDPYEPEVFEPDKVKFHNAQKMLEIMLEEYDQ